MTPIQSNELVVRQNTHDFKIARQDSPVNTMNDK